jgi:hypothetical protein
MIKKAIFVVAILLSYTSYSQDTTKYPLHKFFGSLYTSFFYDLAQVSAPVTGFEVSTALVGMKSQVADNITVQIIYDVTRTTSDIKVFDTAGNSLNVLYFEGSRHTAFLKQAEVDWKLQNGFEINAGQLLNQQYLTLQDRFWGYRFVAVTMQEMYRFGSPADFGVRLKKHFGKTLTYSLGAVNGDGPFRLQGNDGSLLYFQNIRYNPGNFIFQWYSDFMNIKNVAHNSIFAGYKKERKRIGIEYDRIDSLFNEKNNYTQGISLYGSTNITDKIDLFFRTDWLSAVPKYGIKNEYKIIPGINYHKNTFNTAIDLQYFTGSGSAMLFWHFGVKF